MIIERFAVLFLKYINGKKKGGYGLDELIVDILKKNPQKGLKLIIDQYTGLILQYAITSLKESCLTKT